jgi:hypothetical protein
MKQSKHKYEEDAIAVRTEMYRKKITCVMVAKHLGVSDDTVSRALLGERPVQFPRVKNFVKSFKRERAA